MQTCNLLGEGNTVCFPTFFPHLLLNSVCFFVTHIINVHVKAMRKEFFLSVGYLTQLKKVCHDCIFKSAIMLSFFWNTDMHSILSGVGSRKCIENGVTGDSIVEVGIGQLTGRGNRRPAVIRDVTSWRRKSISVGSMSGIPIQLVGPLTNVRQEKCFVSSMWNKIKNSHCRASIISLLKLAWSLKVCFDHFNFNQYIWQ